MTRGSVKFSEAAALIISVMLATGCSEGSVRAEIASDVSKAAGIVYTEAKAERRDVTEYVSVGAGVDYTYAEALTVPYDSNLLEYNVKKGSRLSKGDVIAVFDASAFDYDIRNAEAETDSAYSWYQSSGSEAARLEYEESAKQLELLRYNADRCTIRAPYDCVICSTDRVDTGKLVPAGTKVCSVAKPDDIYITVGGKNDLFSFGMPVKVRFGTQEEYSGSVVMMPEKGGDVLIKLDDSELDRAIADNGNITVAGWGTVVIPTYKALNVLCVPEKAVTTYLGETFCYVTENGERVRIPVEAGRTVNGYTVILSGLTDGDTVSY